MLKILNENRMSELNIFDGIIILASVRAIPFVQSMPCTYEYSRNKYAT